MIEQGFATDADTTTHRGKLVWREGAAIRPPDEIDAKSPARRILFQIVPEEKTVKNRIHWDVNTHSVDALVDAGATILRAPDAEITWTIMADPEGNEFCAFTPK